MYVYIYIHDYIAYDTICSISGLNHHDVIGYINLSGFNRLCNQRKEERQGQTGLSRFPIVTLSTLAS